MEKVDVYDELVNLKATELRLGLPGTASRLIRLLRSLVFSSVSVLRSLVVSKSSDKNVG